MKNLHILPSKESDILYNSLLKSFCTRSESGAMYENDGKVAGAGFWGPEKALNWGFRPVRIIITNEDDIVERDWFLEDEIEFLTFQRFNSDLFSLPESARKIILSTDSEMINSGVSKIDRASLAFIIANHEGGYIKTESYCAYGDECPSQGAYDKQHLCKVEHKIV
jgi:hypothetical protein